MIKTVLVSIYSSGGFTFMHLPRLYGAAPVPGKVLYNVSYFWHDSCSCLHSVASRIPQATLTLFVSGDATLHASSTSRLSSTLRRTSVKWTKCCKTITQNRRYSFAERWATYMHAENTKTLNERHIIVSKLWQSAPSRQLVWASRE